MDVSAEEGNNMSQASEADAFNPNAYVRKDPKPLLGLLEQYAQQNNMACKFKKNSHKIEF